VNNVVNFHTYTALYGSAVVMS